MPGTGTQRASFAAAEEFLMLIEWNGLTRAQQSALLHLHAGRCESVSGEICEQLRNLGLAEFAAGSVILSGIGLALLPLAH